MDAEQPKVYHCPIRLYYDGYVIMEVAYSIHSTRSLTRDTRDSILRLAIQARAGKNIIVSDSYVQFDISE